MLPPGRHHHCVLLRRRTSSDCWLRLAILPTSSTSLQSLPKAGSPGTRGVNRHHVIIVPAWQQTISAFHKFSLPFLCESSVIHLCPLNSVCPCFIPFLLETLCCECKYGMCRLCFQYAQIMQTSSTSVVIIVFSIGAPVVILGKCTTLGIGPSSYDQHALCHLNAAHSCC